MEIINLLVSIPSCYLYKDSYGKGIIMENIYVHNIFQGRAASIHIKYLGWAKCEYNGMCSLSNPPINACVCYEPIYSI